MFAHTKLIKIKRYLFIILITFTFITPGFLRADLSRLAGAADRRTCGLPIFATRAQIKERSYRYKNVRWKTGQVIKVYFVNGTAEERGVVEHYAREWEKYGNIRFEFHQERKTKNEHTILIKFEKQRSGVAGWSSVGGGTTSTTRHSMSFYRNIRSDSTVLHEFGHALGLLHEQDSPGGKYDWKREAAYKYFKEKYNWKRAKVDEAIFNKTEGEYYNWGKFDPRSVMAYWVPGKLFKSGKPLGDSFGLSAGDKEGIAKLYPGKKFPRDGAKTALYYTNNKKYLDVGAKNGITKVYVNGKLVKTLEDTRGGKYGRRDKFEITPFLRGKKTKIYATFTPSKREFSFHTSFYDGKRYIESKYCAQDRNCYKNGRARPIAFYITHFKDRNRGQDRNDDPDTDEPDKIDPEPAVKINPQYNRPMLIAIYEGRSGDAFAYLKKGADPNAKYGGWSALMFAAYYGYGDLVKDLLRRGADANHSHERWDALALAQYRRNSAVVKILREHTGRRGPRVRSRSIVIPPFQRNP